MTELLDPQERLQLLYAERDRRRIDEEREQLALSLKDFVTQAWHVLKPAEPYHHNWHLDAIAEHLEAVSAGEIRRLQIWVPRASMKSMNVSIFWPAWEWTRDPWLRYWTASYELGLAGRLAGRSRDLMASDWFQARWGDLFTLLKEGERYYSNDKGGTRLATAPGSTALGEHGHRIIIDDAINAAAADATSRVVLEATNEWYDATVQGSKADPKRAAEVIIMQRLHENDLAAHALAKQAGAWEVLCLPERFESNHPYAWKSDPRSEGDLLWPSYRGEEESQALAHALGSHRAAGQMQQRPAAREGEILKRHWWRFYDPKLFVDEALKNRRPRFTIIVQTIDCPQKDKESNDLVAMQLWGVIGADRYLLDLKKGHMNYGQAKRAIMEQARYGRTLYPNAAHHVLIETGGYGADLADELKRELSGIHKLSHAREGDKILRAESAAAELESGNHFLPGYRQGADEYSMPDEMRTPADVVDFIDSCAIFPNGLHDDDVDAWSQGINWIRGRAHAPARSWSAFKIRRGM